MALIGLGAVSLTAIAGVLYDDRRASRALTTLIWGGTVVAELGGHI